jgi:hypothetical protein
MATPIDELLRTADQHLEPLHLAEDTASGACRRCAGAEADGHRRGYQRRKVNVSQVFAGQKVGVKQTDDHIWLVTFMEYDLGYFDDETCRLEPIDNPFGSKLLPMSPE